MQKDNNYKVDSDIKVEVVSDIDQNTTEETKQEEYSRKQAAYKLGISISTFWMASSNRSTTISFRLPTQRQSAKTEVRLRLLQRT